MWKIELLALQVPDELVNQADVYVGGAAGRLKQGTYHVINYLGLYHRMWFWIAHSLLLKL